MLAEKITETAMKAQTTGPVEEISEFVGIDFFSLVLPWLLTFAIVYGVLSQLGEDGMPENDGARAIIGIVLAFIIAPVLSPYIGQLAALSAGFVALLGGVLLLIVFVEIAGFDREKDEHGSGFFGWNESLTGLVIAVLAILVFIGSGAHQALGIELPPYIAKNYPLLFFLGFMVMVVWWMVDEG
ncbi:MAG: hypothetical protein ACLFQ8_01345 [Candidatus Aenigmatarchaeota archaeon]